jgi:hypothetical protein
MFFSGKSITMVKSDKRDGRAGGRKRKGPALRKGALRTAVKNVVQSVLAKEAETKMVCYFGGASGATIGANTPYPGNFTVQNGSITTNFTDIKPLIPQTKTGVDDWNRIGSRIRPVRVVVDVDVSLLPNVQSGFGFPNNINVVVYILQHKTLRDYDSLILTNDFTQLLDSGDGVTRQFSGNPVDDNLPVASAHYKLCKKLVIPLRSSTLTGTITAPLVYPIGNNSAPFARRFSVDITKYLPKTLMYNEATNGTNPATTVWPTNSSLFMTAGAYNMDLSLQPTPLPSMFNIQYVSRMSFKDM